MTSLRSSGNARLQHIAHDAMRERGLLPDFSDAVMAEAARAGGKRPPRLTMPTFLLSVVAPFAPILARFLLSPKDLGDALGYAHSTMWMGNERARRELDWQPRDLATGVRDAFGGSWTAAG